MKMFIILTIVLVLLVLTGCEDDRIISGTSGVGSRFDLDYDQTVFVKEPALTLSFVGDVHDSRCCMSCQCFWEGFATIKLKLKKNNDSSFIYLTTLVYNDFHPKGYVDTLGYRFELVALNPYPQSGPYENEEYTATLNVALIPNDTLFAQVQIVDRPPSQIEINEYHFDSASVDGDKIKIWLNHGGGCEPHYYQLYMSPSVFMESYPEQANLYISHFGPPDYCMALVHEELEFDLGPIIDLYHLDISGGGGELRLNIINCESWVMPPNVCDGVWSGIVNIPSLPD